MLVSELIGHLKKLPQDIVIKIDTTGEGAKLLDPHYTGDLEDGPVYTVGESEKLKDVDYAVLTAGKDDRLS